ncbi:MAG TPA: DinB family protein [Flavobacteriales bacterium]|nr:DinB family protein [Flavobacteriales bacterium]
MEATGKLEAILYEVPAKLRAMTGEFVSQRPGPGKWSRKEIMGHLIDSAFNNQQRFVRMQLEKHQDLLQYKQNEWVTLQNYQGMDWNRIIDLWQDLNRHIVHIWKNLDQTKLSNTGSFPDYGTQTLQYIIDDYVVHLEHHLKAVL